MGLLIVGLVLWSLPHLFKRIAPGLRAGMGDGAAKAIVAVTSLAGIVAMVIGYRSAEFVPVYDPPGWGVHLNNLLMVIAVVLLGAPHSKSRLRGMLRHPMLLAVLVWAVAHLIANGDLASLVLFGGLGAWALISILMINARVPDYVPYKGGSLAGDIRLAVISVVAFAVIVGIHAWLGVSPFPG